MNFEVLLSTLNRNDASFRYIVHCIYADYLELQDEESYNKVALISAKFKLNKEQLERIYNDPFNNERQPIQKQIIFSLL